MTSAQLTLVLSAFGILFVPLFGVAWKLGSLAQTVRDLEKQADALFKRTHSLDEKHDRLKGRVDGHLGQYSGNTPAT